MYANLYSCVDIFAFKYPNIYIYSYLHSYENIYIFHMYECIYIYIKLSIGIMERILKLQNVCGKRCCSFKNISWNMHTYINIFRHYSLIWLYGSKVVLLITKIMEPAHSENIHPALLLCRKWINHRYDANQFWLNSLMCCLHEK